MERLERPSKGSGFIPEIDGLRFFAIGTVVAYHANIQACRIKFPGIHDADLASAFSANLVTAILNQGDVGVPVFFAISGFVLGLPFARHQFLAGPKVRLGPYFERRLSRLEVPYLLALLLALLGLIATGREWSPGHVAASAAYVHELVYGTKSTINPISWSLEIEVQFYCLAPLLAYFYRIQSRSLRIVLLLACVLTSILMRGPFSNTLVPVHLDKSVIGYGFYFCVGLIVLETYLCGFFAERRGRSWWYDAIGVVSVAIMMWPAQASELLDAVLFVPSCVGLFVAAFRGRVFNSVFCNRWIVLVGGMCYSIYLLHYGIMIFAAAIVGARISAEGPLWITSANCLLVLVPISVVPCIAFYVIVERPCMRQGWHRQLFSRVVAPFRMPPAVS